MCVCVYCARMRVGARHTLGEERECVCARVCVCVHLYVCMCAHCARMRVSGRGECVQCVQGGGSVWAAGGMQRCTQTSVNLAQLNTHKYDQTHTHGMYTSWRAKVA